MQRTHDVSVRARAFRSIAALLITLGGLAALSGFLGRRAMERPPSAAALAALRARTPPGMTLVPGGPCWLGTDDADADEDAKPQRRAFVPSFYIERQEVTNGAFRRFDPTHRFAPGQENLPVTGVTYDQAAAYAQWAGRRLPTEEEWEKAARGTDGRRYPWGDVWDPRRVAARARAPQPIKGAALAGLPHIRIRSAPPPSRSASCAGGPPRVQPVGSVPGGVSPYGCDDMAGNAWEWVQGHYNGNRTQRILRGGAVGYGESACRTYARGVEGSGAT